MRIYTVWPTRTNVLLEEQTLGATFVSLDELLAQSDVISINCPLTPATRGILSDKEFQKMKDGVYIVNTARVIKFLLFKARFQILTITTGSCNR